MKILVVDHDSSEVAATARILTSEGHTVEVTTDAPAALSAIERDPPDVIIVEMTLLGATPAHALIRQLRAIDAPLAYFIATTADELPGQVRRAFDAGVDDFIRKPFLECELRARVDGPSRIDRRIRSLRSCDLHARAMWWLRPTRGVI